MLTDFELSIDEGGTAAATTRFDGGTPAYMAPERLSAESAQAGAETDMYAVGVVLGLSFLPTHIEAVERGTEKICVVLGSQLGHGILLDLNRTNRVRQ